MNIFKSLLTKTGLNNHVVIVKDSPHQIYRYNGNMKVRVKAYCSRCKEEHELPAAQWYMVKKKKKTNMACLDSLTFEELKTILNTDA